MNSKTKKFVINETYDEWRERIMGQKDYYNWEKVREREASVLIYIDCGFSLSRRLNNFINLPCHE